MYDTPKQQWFFIIKTFKLPPLPHLWALWSVFLQQPLLPLNESVQQQAVLLLDGPVLQQPLLLLKVSVLQQPAPPLVTCTPQPVLPSNVAVLQQSAVPVCVCPTVACAIHGHPVLPSTYLFYSSLHWPWWPLSVRPLCESVLQQLVLPLDVSVLQPLSLPLDNGHAVLVTCDAPGSVCSTADCAAFFVVEQTVLLACSRADCAAWVFRKGKERKFRMDQLQSPIWLTTSSYMGTICAFPHILGGPSSYMTLQLLHSEFPYIWGKFIFFFFSVELTVPLACSRAACTASRHHYSIEVCGVPTCLLYNKGSKHWHKPKQTETQK